LPLPRFYHCATDAAGTRIVADAEVEGGNPEVWIGELGEPGRDAAKWRKIALPESTPQYHPHPVLSPDGKLILFNSDSGQKPGDPQIYLVRRF
jgi:Tol biopolymer transport system component